MNLNNRNHWEMVEDGMKRVSNTPQDLWNSARDYFKWCDMNPIILKKTITTGKEAGKKVEDEKIRPYSVKGLCLHAGVTQEYLKDIRANSSPDSDYYTVVERILMLIFVQNCEMATIGEFNPIFTAKLLNIDNEDTGPKKITIEHVGDLPRLSNSESEILEKLDLENGELKIIQENNSKGKNGSV